MKFFNISLQSFCTLAELFTERREAFAREKNCFIGYSGEKKGELKEKLSSMHNAIKNTAFNTICIFTQSTRQSETAISLARLPHEAFIKLLFIAIDVFNGENTKS